MSKERVGLYIMVFITMFASCEASHDVDKIIVAFNKVEVCYLSKDES